MSAADEIERFAKDLQADQALHQEFKQLGTDQEAMLSLAADKGYAFGLEDLKTLEQGGELSDEQLSNVAGGILMYSDGTTTVSLTSRVIVYKSGKNTFVW